MSIILSISAKSLIFLAKGRFMSKLLIINFETAGSKSGALGFNRLNTKVHTCESGENYLERGLSG